MNFTYFIKLYNDKINENSLDDEKISVIKRILHIKKYIKFQDKCDYIKKLLIDNVVLQDNKMLYDSNKLHFNFVLLMISIYTDLIITNTLYDDLSERDVLELVISCFYKEYESCLSMLNVYLDDISEGRVIL